MNLRQRQETLRVSIKAGKYLRMLHEILTADDWTELVTNPDGGAIVVSRAAEYNGKANIMLRLLNKVLPDLKAIEMTGQVDVRTFIVELVGGQVAAEAAEEPEEAPIEAEAERLPRLEVDTAPAAPESPPEPRRRRRAGYAKA
jgi:hypothetical protein